MYKQPCPECKVDIMRTPHAEGCDVGIQFAQDLIRRNEEKRNQAEAFIAEHFMIVEVK